MLSPTQCDSRFDSKFNLSLNFLWSFLFNTSSRSIELLNRCCCVSSSSAVSPSESSSRASPLSPAVLRVPGSPKFCSNSLDLSSCVLICNYMCDKWQTWARRRRSTHQIQCIKLYGKLRPARPYFQCKNM
jgi:hypothetical protein